ncbi:nitrogenase-stabilizing/protective protein NifW [Methylophilus sp. DW102]|uniref:nitrogenase-stabilizing/protective protein NifW n=1 Tax=Methylophilus sp. DW102 TaxID=3095607 RepID=UPI00308DE128|nr:nitrogenase-stabilizing/protective protein NifW [Methylophilus sp. DW102]
MSALLSRMQTFSAAEEFFEFLGVAYDPQVVHVNRLHILKRFQQYLAREQVDSSQPESVQLAAYQRLLQTAYEDFVHSNAATEKVFKVFQEADGSKTFNLNSLRQTLPSQRA